MQGHRRVEHVVSHPLCYWTHGYSAIWRVLLLFSCSIILRFIILRNSRLWEINCQLKNSYYCVLLSMLSYMYIFSKFIYMGLNIVIHSLIKLKVLIFITIFLGCMIKIFVTLCYFSGGRIKVEWLTYFLLNFPAF